MQKNILGWSKKKWAIDNRPPGQLTYKEREVWWMKVGHNVGSEQNGSTDTYSRPVLIVRGFSGTLFWGIPLSTTLRRSSYDQEILVNNKVSVAVLSQLRALDTRRLGDKIGMISSEEMHAVKHSLRNILS